MDEEEEEEEPEREAEGRAAPEATGIEGRLRMSLMPCGVAAESCCGGLPRDESPPAAGGLRLPGLWAPRGGEGDDEEDEEDEEEAGPAGSGGYAAGYSGVFISAMLCRAARGGLLSKKALCRVPSIAPTANIPRPGLSLQPHSEGAGWCPRRGVGEREAWRARTRSCSAHPEATCQLGRERSCRELLSELRSRNVQGGGSPRPTGARVGLAVLSLLVLDSISISSLFLTFPRRSKCATSFFPTRSKTNPRPAPESL